MPERTSLFLFGLAPGGVCHAVRVAASAVGSYPTVSTLPRAEARLAVCFLLHFPWGRPRRALPGTFVSVEPGLSSTQALSQGQGSAAAVRPSGTGSRCAQKARPVNRGFGGGPGERTSASWLWIWPLPPVCRRPWRQALPWFPLVLRRASAGRGRCGSNARYSPSASSRAASTAGPT